MLPPHARPPAGTLEISSKLHVVKVDAVAAQLFGRTSQDMKGMKLGRLLQLPEHLKLVDLVRKGPKGAMKSHASTAWMVGPVKEMTGNHSDGAPIIVTMQVGASTELLPQLCFAWPCPGARVLPAGVSWTFSCYASSALASGSNCCRILHAQAVGREVSGKGLAMITAEVKAVAFFKGDLAMLERLVAGAREAGLERGKSLKGSAASSSSSDGEDSRSRAGGSLQAVQHKQCMLLT